MIAGTHNIEDVLTDVKQLVVGIEHTHRYDDALKAYRKYKPSRIIGHSLGGLLANSLNNNEKFKGDVRIYNAPLITGITKYRKNVEDFSKYGDIISMLDLKAERTTGSLNPLSAHSYK